MVKKVLKLSSYIISTLSIAALSISGIAFAGASIENTGPGSTNVIKYGGGSSYEVKNKNNVNVTANTDQHAKTGDATVGGGVYGSSYKKKNRKDRCDRGSNYNKRSCSNSKKRYLPKWHNNCSPSSIWNDYMGGGYGSGNTNGGDANTGDADNDAHTGVGIKLDNGGDYDGGSSYASDGDAEIYNTGPHSKNIIKSGSSSEFKVVNNNDVNVDNDTKQRAYSGNATVSGNTNGGSASTGDASNNATTDTNINIQNSTPSPCSSCLGLGGGHSGGSIGTTGPYSLNKILSGGKNVVTIKNNNNVDVSNNTNQKAESGDATVKYNTNGGSASTGDASNDSSTSTSVSIKN